MIKEPPVLTVNRAFSRPHKKAVAALASVPTAFIIDALDGRGALDYEIRPLPDAPESMRTLAGSVLTCSCGPADNLALAAAAALAAPGDVLVAGTDRFEATCVTGDLILRAAGNRGAAGFVTDGLLRDINGILDLGMPVFCRGTSPNSPVCNGPGSVGLDITLGGVTVASGDVIVADRDGIVVVPQERITKVIEGLVDVKAAEAEMLEAVNNGSAIPMNVTDILASDRVEYID
jgi:4-hydroxy-4-methyl-2-oxoglutarate aldolase